MRLRDWSGRRVAAMWMIAAAIEALIIAVAAIHPIVVDTRERTSSVMPILPPDSARPPGGLANTNLRADSLRDSVMALVGKLFADSVARSLVGTEEEAARTAVILAAVILLPVPLAAAAMTTGWLWFRRFGSAPPP